MNATHEHEDRPTDPREGADGRREDAAGADVTTVKAEQAEGVTVTTTTPEPVPADDDTPVISEAPAPRPVEPNGGQDQEADTEPDHEPPDA